MLGIVNAEVYPVSGKQFPGTILIEAGRLKAVGVDVDVPKNATVIDAKGRPVTPGLIEAHGHVGVSNEGIGWEGSDTNERTDPVTPHVSALDGINPEERGFMDFLKGGVTTVQVMPGSANIFGGTGVIIKTKPTSVVDTVILKRDSGMKAALGENPKRAHGRDNSRAPVTRMGSAAIMREWLQRAQEYLAKKEKGEEKYDARLEALLPVIRGEMPLRIHAHRADDMGTAMRIAEEFGLRFSIEHATQGFKMAELLAERQVHCAVGPSMSHEAKVELEGVGFATPVAFQRAGVPFCLTTDHPVVRALYLHMIAGMAAAHGVGADGALRAVTLSAAEHLDVADRVGSLDAGKDADVVIWTGDPLDGRSRAHTVIIDGEVVYQEQ